MSSSLVLRALPRPLRFLAAALAERLATYSAKVQLLKALLKPGLALSRPETAEPPGPTSRSVTEELRLHTAGVATSAVAARTQHAG